MKRSGPGIEGPLRIALSALCACVALPACPALPAGELSAGIGAFKQIGFMQGDVRRSLELAYHRSAPLRPDAFVRFGGGLRAVVPDADDTAPLEAFLDVQLSLQFGPWEPALGPEFGVCGFGHVGQYRPDLARVQNERIGAAYVALDLAPVRFRSGRLTVTGFSLQIGTNLSPPGRAARVSVGVLTVGVSL